MSDNARVLARLLGACQAAKQSLSAAAQAQVAIEADGADYLTTISRATLEELSSPVATAAAALASQALLAAGLSADDVDALLLCGGGCRMGRVQAALSALCPKASVQFGATAEETACRGAALSGALLKGLPRENAVGGRAAEVSGVLERRKRLPVALGVRLADGSTLTLAQKHAATPLTRVSRLGVGGGVASALVELVELRPATDENGAVDVSDGADGGAGAAHVVARLAVRDVPAECAALRLVLSVDAAGCVELRCEAEMAAEGDAAEGGAEGEEEETAPCVCKLLASTRVEPRNE